MVYVIADTHYFHEKMLEIRTDFQDVLSMNEYMIEKWNSVISDKYDEVIVLGDFALTGFEKVSDIISRLNGKKTLILGNHDRRNTVTWWERAGFDRVISGELILFDKLILSHKPILGVDLGGFINIHGHIGDDVTLSPKHYNLSKGHKAIVPVLLKKLADNLLVA